MPENEAVNKFVYEVISIWMHFSNLHNIFVEISFHFSTKEFGFYSFLDDRVSGGFLTGYWCMPMVRDFRMRKF